MTEPPNSVTAASKPFLLDLAALDLSSRAVGREYIARTNPHRGQMALLDYIVWEAADHKAGVGLWQVRDDEFWVPGHFPNRPLLPGVLQVEAGAQLCVYLYNSRFPEPKLAAFTHIIECSFRGQVVPGDDFYLLAKEIMATPRRFRSDIQGIVNGKVAYQAEIQGIVLSDP